MSDKGASLALFLNYFITFVVSLIVPYFEEDLGILFMIFGLILLVVIIYFIKSYFRDHFIAISGFKILIFKTRRLI
jgi:hypothetical protein